IWACPLWGRAFRCNSSSAAAARPLPVGFPLQSLTRLRDPALRTPTPHGKSRDPAFVTPLPYHLTSNTYI
ncbi:MAG: hypothetical protein LBI58_05895, partial [Tannerellaceae bacterium]|nr:hypothetical protein [Tannerellaceae bacterium]